MNTIVTIAFLALGLVLPMTVQSASAGSLSALSSACRTGDYEACSRYNSAIIAQQNKQSPVLLQGYDPFAIVPAKTRTPSQPTNSRSDIAVGKAGTNLGATKKSQ